MACVGWWLEPGSVLLVTSYWAFDLARSRMTKEHTSTDHIPSGGRLDEEMVETARETFVDNIYHSNY